MSDERDAEIEQFIDELFRNGAGQEADRLVLTKDHKGASQGFPSQDLGGWGKPAVRERVTALVAKRVAAERERAARNCDDLVTFTKNHETGGCGWCDGLEKAAEDIRAGKVPFAVSQGDY